MSLPGPAQQENFRIHLPQFEGPFDLLLFFIERDEIDIYDIPISQITREFLDYIHQLERLNIDIASEFIVVAAQLMRIKAKMLLPRKQMDDEGNEIDPRQELVDRILEYKRYKSIVEEMRHLEDLQSAREPRGYANTEMQQLLEDGEIVDLEMESLTLYKLMRAFERVMKRLEEPVPMQVHTVFNWTYSVADQQQLILDKVTQTGKATFEAIFANCESRVHAIVTFLALLELLNAFEVSLIQGEGNNRFWIVPPIETPDENELDQTVDQTEQLPHEGLPELEVDLEEEEV
jgi:segregation and condensation protein A